MKTYFRSQDLWDIVYNGYTTPEDGATLSAAQRKEYKENQQKDSQALLALQMSLADEIFPRIMGATTAKEAWDTLQEEFQGNEKVRTVKLQSLRREFENIRMRESETAQNYYSRVKEIVTQMRAYGENIPDKKIVEKILISCTEKYDSIVTAIEESKDIDKMSVSELMGSLEAFEKRLSRRNESPIESETAFQTKVKLQSQKFKKGFPPCGICKKSNHMEKDCWFKDKPRCEKCKRFGHIGKFCRNKQDHEVNYTEERNPYKENYLFYVCRATSQEERNIWYLDSACSSHMTNDESIFCKLEKIKEKVKIGNGDYMEAIGKGTIAIHTRKGVKFITDVLLVPTIDQNLLSVGQMMRKGYSLRFEGDSCIIHDKQDKSLKIARIKMRENQSFPLYLRYAKKTEANSKKSNMSSVGKEKTKLSQEETNDFMKVKVEEEPKRSSANATGKKTKTISGVHNTCNLSIVEQDGNGKIAERKVSRQDEEKTKNISTLEQKPCRKTDKLHHKPTYHIYAKKLHLFERLCNITGITKMPKKQTIFTERQIQRKLGVTDKCIKEEYWRMMH